MALKRNLNPMSDAVREALADEGLEEAFAARPDYQRNDYLGWINRAKKPETKARRTERMLSELRAGEGYMEMAWTPR